MSEREKLGIESGMIVGGGVVGFCLLPFLPGVFIHNEGVGIVQDAFQVHQVAQEVEPSHVRDAERDGVHLAVRFVPVFLRERHLNLAVGSDGLAVYESRPSRSFRNRVLHVWTVECASFARRPLTVGLMTVGFVPELGGLVFDTIKRRLEQRKVEREQQVMVNRTGVTPLNDAPDIEPAFHKLDAGTALGYLVDQPLQGRDAPGWVLVVPCQDVGYGAELGFEYDGLSSILMKSGRVLSCIH